MEGLESNNKLSIIIGIIILTVVGSLFFLLNSNSKIAKNSITIKNQATRATFANNTGSANPQGSQSTQQNKKSNDFSFTAQERPAFQFPSVAYASDLKNKTKIYNSRGVEVNTGVDIDPKGSGSVVTLAPSKEFMPGKYTMVINDKGKNISQDFTWGVLAINTNKSIYTPGQTALLALAVLDETGKMICDAKVTLKITDPNGNTTLSTTDNGLIRVNQECFVKDITTKPDYETAYKVQAAGVYQMNLSAVTKNGTFQIQDSFLVQNSVDFDVERTTGTRIFPFRNYPVVIKISANKDFSGTIKDFVPASFDVNSLDGVKTYDNLEDKNGIRSIIWNNISLKRGQSISIGYDFKSPVISPEFYLIGPLTLTSGNALVFEENRAWQLAIDDVNYFSTITTTSGLMDYFRLGEASGPTAADSVLSPTTAHNGTYMTDGASATFGVAGAISNDSNTAVSFTTAAGTEHQRIDVVGMDEFGSTAGGRLTFEAWIKMRTTSLTDKGLFNRVGGATNRWFMYRCGGTCTANDGANTNTCLGQVIKFGANSQAICSTTQITDTNWHYVAGVKGVGNDWRVYIDGKDVSWIPTNVAFSGTNFGTVQLGLDVATDYWDGSLDEIAFYNRALTGYEIAAHYNVGLGDHLDFKFEGLQMQGLQIN